jgi:hypothetical protein
MTNRRMIAYVLIGLGTITLLARLSGGAGWLWIGLVAAAMLFAYARQRTYGFLVLGAILAGTAAGILLQEVFRNEAFFLISLGAGIAAIDLVERRANRWPRTLGAALAVIGVLIGLQQAGAFASVWFALLLIAVGVWIITRGSDRTPFPPPRSSDPAPAPGEPRPAPAPAPGEPRPAPAPAPGEPRPAPGPARPPEGADAPPTGPEGPAAGGPSHGPAAAAPSEAVASVPADAAARERRERLTAWRERVAAEDAKAPQAVLSDEVLDDVAARAPADLAELAAVRGIGPVKLERYGAALLEVLHRDGA